MKVFKKLKLTAKEINKLYAVFLQMDLDSSCLIKNDEFFSYLRLEATPFNIAIFSIFDTDGNGTLSFGEFVSVVNISLVCMTFTNFNF